VLARELTKLYEQFFYGTLADLQQWLLDDKMHQKGEFVIMLAATKTENKDNDKINSNVEQILTILIDELPLKQAAKIAAKLTGINKNTLYKQGLKLQQK
jgi:16S rRNA (cytidine1402-2'-O)-methyltransferase